MHPKLAPVVYSVTIQKADRRPPVEVKITIHIIFNHHLHTFKITFEPYFITINIHKMPPFAFTIAAIVTLVSAAPTLQSRGTGTGFNLHVPGNPNAPETVAPLRSGIWSVGSLNSKTVLFSDRSKGSLFYEYGPEASSSVGTASVGITIVPGGTATVPDGRPIQVVINNGTTSVEIVEDTDGLPKLAFDGGKFQACAELEGQTDAFILSYVQQGQRFLADCTPVDVISVCSSTGVGAPMLGQLGKPHEVDCQSN